MNRNKLIIALGLLLNATSLLAGISNDIPSCYEANKITNTMTPEKEVFVLIDQTTKFDANLQKSIKENTGSQLKPGTSYVVSQFSSFSQGHYMDVLSAGTFEQQIPDDLRNDISVRLLKKFDSCMQGQKKYGLKVAATALNKALAGSSSDLAKSDVLAGLKDLSNRVKKSQAKIKIVILASDMLENSSISSFYAKQAVRLIDPKKELKLVTDNNMVGDFGGAKVYIIGAGLLAEDVNNAKGVYRSPQIMQALSTFWKEWFKLSNAEVVELGQPALLNPIN